MQITLKELAAKLNGELVGDPAQRVETISTLEVAGPGQVAILLEKKKKSLALASVATALIVPMDFASDNQNLIKVPNPRAVLPLVVNLFAPEDKLEYAIHPTAQIASSAVIASNVRIGPYCVIGENAVIGEGTLLYPHVVIGADVQIGTQCRLYPHVVIYHHCVLGNQVILHAGTVIGSDGFGYIPNGKAWIKVPQIGKVIIASDVEIGANCTIDRGAIGDTVIGEGTKIDNLVHFAHNTIVGKYCAITAQVGLAGSTTLGEHVQVAGQAGFSGHIQVGDDVLVMGRAGVSKDTAAGQIISGFPAQDHKTELTLQSKLRRLPAQVDKIFKLLKDKGVTNDID